MILSDPEWQAIALSLKVSTVAVLFSLPFGILMAWVLVRCRFPGKTLLDSLIHLPLVLPPVVVGYLLLIGFGRRGFIGEYLYDWFGFTFAFSWRGAALASAVIAFPLMVHHYSTGAAEQRRYPPLAVQHAHRLRSRLKTTETVRQYQEQNVENAESPTHHECAK